ncbi:sporulation protein, YlmC/YmxH family [Thermoclostridium stercorarium subsp. stercorarium DSM 8532]|jgi:YlmC/YmxH family sporulation protein|uniref:Sporulation protein, YlmC/YmxH family n=3 Tax=Thermoclostridium stercorarium TaxID=1510 RepID=L7VPD5_THES1|nr:YlmC/YmxH family sporulation protein [Thermoclostridium stercorarium]AGC68539.1 sporulation protein, YlmC/YmxH family [Thermoclostridium stercorarium subsp. stercorarium DSM 8532]AGI39555.1 sporulation protein [Thermoclostridium stercorarium subsp. stercorarium DSM 8532]ANW98890.1 sporulation protein, YlmC/YmxH family [Thermoclostridium stercorarium subsp. thermolacticum DSM 2910]ANX01417.1 sporulation protein, YlmC/YmxH family [Thermoclostridium stercorarium subsp. leptospartum DSM 9219]UZ
MLQREYRSFEREGIQLPNCGICRITDLRQKEVINIADGKRLGFVKDAEFNLESGKIVSLILPGRWSIFRLFGRIEEMVIPWKDVRKVGDDIILVELKER